MNEIEIKENNNKYILNKRDPSGEVESITNKGSDINIFENFIYLYFNKNDTTPIMEFATYSIFFILKNLGLVNYMYIERDDDNKFYGAYKLKIGDLYEADSIEEVINEYVESLEGGTLNRKEIKEILLSRVVPYSEVKPYIK